MFKKEKVYSPFDPQGPLWLTSQLIIPHQRCSLSASKLLSLTNSDWKAIYFLDLYRGDVFNLVVWPGQSGLWHSWFFIGGELKTGWDADLRHQSFFYTNQSSRSAFLRGRVWNQLALFDIGTSVRHLVVDQIHNENSFKLANFVSTGYQWHKIHFVLVYGYFFQWMPPFLFQKQDFCQIVSLWRG